MGALNASPAQHAQTTAWVVGVVRERIEAGLLLPGDKLAEQHLAAEVGVSRNTLREAFGMLSSQGLVERIPNRGVFVASPGAEGVREIYAARRALEPSALLWAELTTEAVAELQRLVETASEHARASRVSELASVNQDVHRAVVGLHGSAELSELMERVLARMRLVFAAMREHHGFHEHYAQLNRHVVELLAQGRRAEAAQAMRDYLGEAETELLSALADGHRIGTGRAHSAQRPGR